jgi:hypothetical protein
MSSSLEVPTATSVRCGPVKLLIDNRVVINNHLAGSWREGVVHPPDRYALVKGAGADAEMNRTTRPTTRPSRPWSNLRT